ncbi:MAG: RsmD family RNA methyltransferase [Myxococcota bacterium]|nr:RsmD family RNA methyltransferase [Myxococcota bacterium]
MSRGVRITGGTLRGRVLAGSVPRGVRPSGSRLREALFSMVGQDLTGWTVCDAFGGTGLLAFEAASRGAGPITIVEKNRAAASGIRSSAAELAVSVSLRLADARTVLTGGSWDLVMLDPPYEESAEVWVELAAPATRRILVVEHSAETVLPESVGSLQLDRRRRYGDSALTLFRPR